MPQGELVGPNRRDIDEDSIPTEIELGEKDIEFLDEDRVPTIERLKVVDLDKLAVDLENKIDKDSIPEDLRKVLFGEESSEPQKIVVESQMDKFRKEGLIKPSVEAEAETDEFPVIVPGELDLLIEKGVYKPADVDELFIQEGAQADSWQARSLDILNEIVEERRREIREKLAIEGEEPISVEIKTEELETPTVKEVEAKETEVKKVDEEEVSTLREIESYREIGEKRVKALKDFAKKQIEKARIRQGGFLDRARNGLRLFGTTLEKFGYSTVGFTTDSKMIEKAEAVKSMSILGKGIGSAAKSVREATTRFYGQNVEAVQKAKQFCGDWLKSRREARQEKKERREYEKLKEEMRKMEEKKRRLAELQARFGEE